MHFTYTSQTIYFIDLLYSSTAMVNFDNFQTSYDVAFSNFLNRASKNKIFDSEFSWNFCPFPEEYQIPSTLQICGGNSDQ